MAGDDAEAARVTQRVQKLLRLARNNPNVEEARTAALHAARLIDEHGLEVGPRIEASRIQASRMQASHMETPRVAPPPAPAAGRPHRAPYAMPLRLVVARWVVWLGGLWYLAHQLSC